jgi:dipicolinate synthase subunit B
MDFDFHGKNIGIAFTGSFCTYEKIFAATRNLSEKGANLYTIFSDHAASIDTRFGNSQEFINRAKDITGKYPIITIPGAEPIGPKAMLDILVIAPCTGNTLSKLAAGITDSTVTMACKAHLRIERPLILGISTNDGLSGNACNLGTLLARRRVYFVPFTQDDPAKKPNSLVADFSRINETVQAALDGRQLQPLLC